MHQYARLFSTLIVLGACAPAVHSGGPRTSPVPAHVIPSYADTAAFRSGAQATVQEFANRALAAAQATPTRATAILAARLIDGRERSPPHESDVKLIMKGGEVFKNSAASQGHHVR